MKQHRWFEILFELQLPQHTESLYLSETPV